MWIRKIGMLGLGLGALVALAGCQSSGSGGPSHEMSSMAAHCDGCKTTWVQTQRTAGQGNVVGYTERQKMACPDCKDKVSNFFSTGKLEHTCKACGGNMMPCEGH